MIIEALPNPYAEPPGCGVCKDFRSVQARDFTSQHCRACGCACPKRTKGEPPATCFGCKLSADLKREVFKRHHARPTICELDLTLDELVTFRMMKAGHPNASKLTVLSWIEGQRYEPAKDRAFAEEVERELTRRNGAFVKSTTPPASLPLSKNPAPNPAPRATSPGAGRTGEAEVSPAPGAVVLAEGSLEQGSGIVGPRDGGSTESAPEGTDDEL